MMSSPELGMSSTFCGISWIPPDFDVSGTDSATVSTTSSPLFLCSTKTFEISILLLLIGVSHLVICSVLWASQRHFLRLDFATPQRHSKVEVLRTIATYLIHDISDTVALVFLW